MDSLTTGGKLSAENVQGSRGGRLGLGTGNVGCVPVKRPPPSHCGAVPPHPHGLPLTVLLFSPLGHEGLPHVAGWVHIYTPLHAGSHSHKIWCLHNPGAF